jgi:hypothetical protein
LRVDRSGLVHHLDGLFGLRQLQRKMDLCVVAGRKHELLLFRLETSYINGYRIFAERERIENELA